MKSSYLIILFLLFGPILDVTSFYGLPISIVVRGVFLASITLYLIIKKKDLKIVIPLLIFSIISFMYQFLYLKFGLMNSVSSILKFLYLPISIIYFKDYVFPVKEEKVFTTILFTYVGIYLLSYITGIGADAYLESDGKSGFKGLFSSINEFSAILIGLLPIVCSYLKNNKRYILMSLIIVLVLICSLLIGTKVLMGGVIFCIGYLLFQERERLFFKRSKSVKIGIIVSMITILIIGCFLFTKTRTYQNMVVQNDFFKVESVFSLDFVNRVVYNNRLTFLSENFDYFKDQNIGNILLGIGIADYDIKMVEIDLFDIIFRYGIIGIIIYGYSLVSTIKLKKISTEQKISLILFLVISLTSGHVLIYPAVCIYIGVISNSFKSMIKS